MFKKNDAQRAGYCFIVSCKSLVLVRPGEDPVPPSGQNQTLCFDVRPGESGSGVGSLGPVPPSGQNQTRICKHVQGGM